MPSLNRLSLQLWPSAVFLFFMAAGPPEPASPAGGLPETASLQPQKRPRKGKKHRETKEMK